MTLKSPPHGCVTWKITSGLQSRHGYHGYHGQMLYFDAGSSDASAGRNASARLKNALVVSRSSFNPMPAPAALLLTRDRTGAAGGSFDGIRLAGISASMARRSGAGSGCGIGLTRSSGGSVA